MEQPEDLAHWVRVQVAMLETMLRDFEAGSRNAEYSDANGRQVDETEQVIAQLRSDIGRLKAGT